MKVLVIGGGGREHAIVWKLSQSKRVDRIFCAPGNAGIAELAECVDINPNDHEKLLDFVKYEWVDLTIVGPEEPLANGIVEAFEKTGRKILGTSKKASQIEASKVFAKDFMRRYGIPTADYRTFTSYTHAEEHVRLRRMPCVIKADGLAAGKGVIVAKDSQEAMEALRLIMKDNAFGKAGDRVIVEDCLEGEEASYIAFLDGHTIKPLASSQDHKRALDGDLGPNTGGMGAYSPAPVVTPLIEERIMEKVMRPVLEGFKAEGIKYKGILYAGVMINRAGEPRVLEFNCRLGDPEAQPLLMRLESDLLEVALAICEERLGEIELQWTERPAVCVVMASGGYPEGYKKGLPIAGLKEAGELEDVTVFHAGTAHKDSEVVTSGGRVLGVTALGDSIASAKTRAYEAVEKIHFDNVHYRRDISDKALNRPDQGSQPVPRPEGSLTEPVKGSLPEVRTAGGVPAPKDEPATPRENEEKEK